MTAARRVKAIQGAPARDTDTAVFRFTMENGSVDHMAIPQDLLVGLGGMAMSFRQSQDGELSALRVDGIDIINASVGQTVLICTLGERSMSLPLLLSDSVVAQLARHFAYQSSKT
nr:hypothetical protein [Brevundimonas diminuta]